MKHRIAALVAAVALAALAIPLIIGVASAATPMTLQPAQVENSTPTLTACSTPTFPVLRTRPPTATPTPSLRFPPPNGGDLVQVPAAITDVTPPPTAVPTPCSTPTNPPTDPPTNPPTTPPTATPAQSEQGQTATTVTPPPTSTGSSGSSNNSTPLFELLICLAFGGLALAAVGAQRRSLRR